MGERLLCKQDVIGSIPVSSTISPRHIEANLLEIESPLLKRTLILEHVAEAICSERAPGRVAAVNTLRQTIFDN